MANGSRGYRMKYELARLALPSAPLAIGMQDVNLTRMQDACLNSKSFSAPRRGAFPVPRFFSLLVVS